MHLLVLAIIAALLAVVGYHAPYKYHVCVVISLACVVCIQYALVCTAKKLKNKRWPVQSISATAVGIGFVFGCVLYGSVLAWLPAFFCVYASLSVCSAWLLLGVLVGYFGIVTALWWYIAVRVGCAIKERLPVASGFGVAAWLMVSMSGYWLFIAQYSVWWTGRAEGIPIFSPLVPLAAANCKKNSEPEVRGSATSLHIVVAGSPCEYTLGCGHDARVAAFMKHFAQVMNTMRPSMNSTHSAQQSVEQIIVCFPESSVPLDIAQAHDVLAEVCAQIPVHSGVLIGARRSVERAGRMRWYQTVYAVTQAGIQDWYDKQHRVPWFEAIPPWWRGHGASKQLFLADSFPIAKGRSRIPCWYAGDMAIVPVICSDLLTRDCYAQIAAYAQSSRASKQSLCVVWLVNDSWFPPCIRRLLRLHGERCARDLGVFLVYCGCRGICHDARGIQ